MGQGWKMNGMLRGGAWSPAAFLAQKPHENVCWRNFAASEKTMPRAFPGYQDKWPILSTLRVLFCPLAPAPHPASSPGQRRSCTTGANKHHVPLICNTAAKKGKKPLIFLHTRTYICTYIHTRMYLHIYMLKSVCNTYTHTKKLQFLLATLTSQSQDSPSRRVWPKVVITGALPAPVAGL